MKKSITHAAGALMMISAGILFLPITTAHAFVITGQLTGDIRPQNPDNLIVDVTITVNNNTASWVVDINSPLHPTVKLDEFYFNLANTINPLNLTFSGFNPTGWAINFPASVQGAGGTTFQFEALDPPKDKVNAANVTNSQNLTFNMILSTGIFTANDFLNAPLAISNDAGSGLGNYSGGGSPPQQIPEPTTHLLLGLGLLGLLFTRRAVRRIS
ncbi:MAG: PEP-CTERM sorting domain-containing protein [Gammaproteobacteria bacterium]|nr:PEP-CTERM sorting domain-containing protein [Gammaproteobacteria bacterium]